MRKISLAAIFSALCLSFFGCSFASYSGLSQVEGGICSFEYSADEVESVVIDWISGSVTVTESNDSILKAEETDTGLLDAQKMRCSIKGKTLYVEFCRSGYVGSFPVGTKLLTVEVPTGASIDVKTSSAPIAIEAEQLNEVKLRTASGGIKSGNINAENFFANSTSGSVRLGNIVSNSNIDVSSTSGEVRTETLFAADKIFAESTSGKISIKKLKAASYASAENTSGGVDIDDTEAKEFTIKTTSGSIKVGVSACESIHISSASGSVKLELLNGLGATVKYKSTSGRFDHGDCRLSGDNYIYGNGACFVNIKTSSGGIKVIQ